LGGAASRLYTRSMPKSNSEVAGSERHSSVDKNKKEIDGERDSWRDREMPDRVIYDFNPIYKAAELAIYARVQ
jgi:hypothetical protein